ncbi:MAG: CoA transferase, partial [Alphaproteobacteria bacterium]
PNLTPSQLYRTADGWIFIMCNKEKFWAVLAHAVDHPEWADDPDFATFADRLRNRERVTAMLDDALSGRTTAEWLEIFGGKVPAAPVNDMQTALDNPFVRDTGRVVTLPHPAGTAVGTVGPAIRVPGEAPLAAPAPAMGADTDDILHELGYDTERIAALRADGAV